MFDKLRTIRWRFPGREDPSSSGRPLTASLVQSDKPQADEKKQRTVAEKKVYAQKRRYPRHSIERRNVLVHMLFQEEVVIENISVSGACIRTISDLHVGGRYLLSIPDKKPHLSLRGMVIWNRNQANGEEMSGGFLAGIRFSSPSFEEIVRLKDFMRRYGEPYGETVSALHEPSALRFHIRAEERALLSFPEALGVKKISLGGMLIESRRPLECDSQHSLKLHLSPSETPIKIRGRIASISSSADTSRPAFDVGVEFLDLEVRDRARVDRFILNL